MRGQGSPPVILPLAPSADDDDEEEEEDDETGEEPECKKSRHYLAVLQDLAKDDGDSLLGSTEEHVWHAVYGKESEEVIQRDDAVSSQDCRTHAKQLSAAKLAELVALFELKCFRRIARRLARNLVDTKWVHKWKNAVAERFIKAVSPCEVSRICVPSWQLRPEQHPNGGCASSTMYARTRKVSSYLASTYRQHLPWA